MRKVIDFKKLNLSKIRDEIGLYIYEHGTADLKLISNLNKAFRSLENVKIIIDC